MKLVNVGKDCHVCGTTERMATTDTKQICRKCGSVISFSPAEVRYLTTQLYKTVREVIPNGNELAQFSGS